MTTAGTDIAAFGRRLELTDDVADKPGQQVVDREAEFHSRPGGGTITW